MAEPQPLPAVEQLTIASVASGEWGLRAAAAVSEGGGAQFASQVNLWLAQRVVLGDGVTVAEDDRQVAAILMQAGLVPWDAGEDDRVSHADLLRWFDLVQASFGADQLPWGPRVEVNKYVSADVLKKAMLKSVGVDDADVERIRAEKKAQKAAKQAAKKASKPAKQTTPAKSAVPDDDVSRLDIRVGNIVAAKKHPDADGLYVEDIDCGDDQPRTVCSGLVKFIPDAEDLLGPCVVVCNLKPANMRGIRSQAMVLCASSVDGTQVQLVKPPAGATSGTRITCAGHDETPDAQLNPKKKIFEKIAPDLVTTAEGVASWRGIALATPSGVCTTSLPNAPIK